MIKRIKIPLCNMMTELEVEEKINGMTTRVQGSACLPIAGLSSFWM